MNTKLTSKILSAGLAVVVAMLGAVSFPGVVSAQGTNPPTTPTAPAKPGDKAKEALGKAFENQYKRVVENAAEFKTNLDKANEAVKKAQDLIAERKSKGIDTAAGEKALATYQAEVKKAQASYDEAKKILDAHAGFDASGTVTDRTAAKDTVLNAAKALREAQKTLATATRDFQKSVREIMAEKKDALKDKAKPTATPKP